uniref:[histone H3]-lysine(4) N-methyltransferase n=1 Tax=Pygocentrus nattereri TaxID=42514 RepID=A0AAR2IYS0_PYGNA
METAESGGTQEPDGKGQPEDGEGSAAVSSLCGEEEEQPSSSPVSPHSEAGEAETSAASGGAQSSEQLCALCHCGARSLLGQGELKLFKATPGFEARTEGRSHGDRSAADSQSGRSRGPESAGTDEAGSRSWDELHHVGLPDDTDVHSLFDESGQCWAHQQCALWSEGVCQAEDQSLLNVDRAIHSGSTEHCAYCKRLGASIKCCEEGCGRSYHYPCAGGAGTFQDFRKLSVLCTEHIHLALSKSAEEANCVLCDSSGDLLDQLFCTSCGLHYHGLCLDISVTPLKRAGWQCPECKVCQTCKNPGEDTKMLVCDMCDKGYHTFCLQPVMDSIPTNGWRCMNCRVCVQCGTRSSSQWHHNSLLCENCAGQQDSAPLCALCAGSLDPEVHKDPLSCQHCKRWFHLECERQVEGHVEVQAGEDYVCSVCKHAGFEPGPLHMDIEPLQEEVEMHMEVEEATQPAPSDPPKDVKPESSPESPQQKPDPAPEPPLVQGFLPATKAELPQETPSLINPETAPHQVEELKLNLEEQKSITSPTKELSSVSEPSKEEPMEVSSSEIPETSMETEPSSAKPVPKVEEERVCLTVEQHERDTGGLALDGERSLAKLSSLVEERTSLKPLPIRQPESLTSSGQPTISPQSHSGLGETSSNVPSATFIPFTPKIGMGKPAISKRKFSPGRPRVKQKCLHSPPPVVLTLRVLLIKLTTCRRLHCCFLLQGRGSGFPGRRRPRGAGLTGRGGRGRSRIKTGVSPIPTPGVNTLIMHTCTVLLHNCVSCIFTIQCPDMCVVCGSFGQGMEGRLLACAQCGQCYHPYCVNIKITKVVLNKGWRCLECTVCEACGQASDPGRLLLCDDCDISYHTYCLEPPLQNVPNGSWKCKWCVSCTQCGATSPGMRCEWQNNYTQCAPCASLACCPICLLDYSEEEIILQCRQCDRWMHASCQGFLSEEEVEKVADSSFDCSLCQGHKSLSPGSAEGPLTFLSTELTRTYTQDGVCLTESGLSQLQSLANTASRRRRPKPKLKLKIINQNSVAVLQTPPDPQAELCRDADLDDSRAEGELVDGEGKSDSSPEREAVVEDESKGAETCKKRKRKPYRPGIGGFMVRQRNRMGPGKAKPALGRKDSTGSVSETQQGKDEGWGDVMPDTPVDEKPPVSDFPENPEVKVRKRYRKKKTKLEEAFPTYLQVWIPFGWAYKTLVTLQQTHTKWPKVCGHSTSHSQTVGVKMSRSPFSAVTFIANVLDLTKCIRLFSVLNRERKFSQMAQDAAGPWSATGPGPASAPPPAPVPEGEGDSLSTAQKSTLKWEKEETLGELATVAPVLYTNVNFPNLKEEYPDWQTRVKQIAKLWRKASSQDRAPYVQKARDNRAALRINKVQMSNETIKRQQQQPQVTQALEVFDPAIPPLDPELLFKDPLKHKESEQEQEWKLRQQMRQKSKQQAKIEATQKLEQVKNEQLQQQQQQQHLKGGQSEMDTSGSLQSPVSSQTSNGNMSPMQSGSKNGFSKPQLPGTPTSGSPDDVFLRPHPPPPSSGSQPQSPQMFSPGSSGSRPSSPWDPYTKMVGTPRPPPSGPAAARRNSESGKSPRILSEECGKASSVHEPIGSPTALNVDPYAKPPDTPRPAGPTDPFLKPMCPPRSSQTMEGRHLIGSPGHDPFSRAAVRKEAYPRMPQGRMILSDPYVRPLLAPIPGSNESGSVQLFKTPMPPPQAQESNTVIHSRRPIGDPFERPVMPPRSTEAFSQSQQNDPYAHPPLTPHPVMGEGYENQARITRQPQAHPFSQPSPLAHQSAGNPYARTPSTPRPDYSQCDPFSQTPFSNPYARMPGTPRPHDPEPYAHQSATSHPAIMNQPPQQTQNRILSPMSMDPYAQPPGTPHPGMPERFLKSQNYQRNQDPFNHPPGMSRQIAPDPHAQPAGASQALLSDPYAQPPRTPHPGGAGQVIRPGLMSGQDSFSPPQALMQDAFASPAMPGSQTPRHPGMADENTQTVPLAEAEERLRQRQRIRELILRQQQQKSAIRQEKSAQEQPVNVFHGPYPGDPRGYAIKLFKYISFKYFPPGVQGPGLRPHQMQDSMMEGHPQMRRSMSIDLGKSLGGNPMGLQPLPPRGMHVQQHNIMGQPFIELRHRPPEARLRLPFAGPVMQGNRMESPTQPQRPPGLTSGQEMAFPANQGPKPVDPTITQTQGVVADLQGTMSMESLHQPSVPLRTGHPQIPLMRSMSQPASNETFSGPASSAFPAASAGQNSEVILPTNEGSEEKIDADESAVKDLEDVEVKDLVDTDLENLNLDTDDGKDLDLETNDLHLEEIFLTSGKFDIIAYTDADLDLSEDLDLNDPIDDHTETSEPQKSQTKKTNSSDDASLPSNSTSEEGKTGDKPELSPGHIKKEVSLNQGSLKSEKDIKIEVKDGLSHEVSCKNLINETKAVNQEDYGSINAISQIPKPGIHPDATPVLSSLLVNVPPDNESHKQDSCGQSVVQSKLQESGLQETISSTLLGQGAISVQGLNPGMVVDSEGTLDIPGTIEEQSSGPIFGVDQKDALLSVEQAGMLSQSQQALLSGQGQQNRPLLLEEQPLLLQDLLDQERQEQQQQKQMQAMIRQRSSDSFFPNIDFDAITDPIMKAKMVALKGINKVMVQNNMGMSQMLAAYMTRPSPPSFGQGFTNEAQKVQYEDWLRETQKLLQMQQKFLEEQIGAHRKSKKALSAKQRTAKKAGREFPEEDAEQLKHVTEQQGVVQKQLEQIRKQQKEHAELIEEYRVKQQQGGMQPQMMPAMLPMQGHPGMVPTGPVNQPLIGPTMPMQLHPGQTNAPSMPAWHPGASGHVAPQMPGVMPPQMMQGQPPPPALGRPGQGQSSGESPHVNFDDTNPFSESFQERERKERLREQQERQRVQLMKEVERQRMKQRMEMEQQQQQGLLSQDGNMRTLSQMPFYNQNLPQDFMQPHRSQQQIQRPGFPQQQGMQPGLGGPPSGPMMGNGPFPQEVRPGFGLDNQLLHGGPNFVQGQPRPSRFPGPNMVPQNPGHGHPFGESAMPLPPNFPGSGPSLIQLYSNIIPEEKGKKKQNRKKKKDDDTESLRAPSTPHSDLTAPLTPCVSDTSSTPTRNPLLFGEHEMCETSQPGSSTPGSQSSQPHSELERQLSEGSCVGAELNMGQQDIQDRILSNIKMERIEASDCHGPKGTNMDMGLGMVKVEVEKGSMSPLPAGQSPASSSKGEGGNELLKHLLKNKGTPPPVLPHQKSEDSLRSEEEASNDSKVLLRQSSMDSTGLSGHPDFAGSLLSEEKKKPRTKRTPKSGERPAPRSKRRKKEEDERQVIYPSTEPIMANLKQQNNLSNPPTPPASLPPTPPPVARQKLLNGFATTEELASKAAVISGHDVTKGLPPRPLHVPFKTEEELFARALAHGPKTVDVPASLPTPPHNNQEEIRGQEQCEDRDTPDSFVPSSSPESVVGMEISRYPDLSRVKQEPPSPALSPVMPMFPSRGKGSEAKLCNIKTEPSSVFFGSSFGAAQNGSGSGLVSIAITLKPAAAEVRREVRGRRQLFIENIVFLWWCFLPSGPIGGREQYQEGPGSPGPKPQWCRQCKVVVLGNGVKKPTKDQQSKAGHFMTKVLVAVCFQASVALLEDKAVKESPSKAQHQYNNNMSSLDVHCLAQLQSKPSSSSPNPLGPASPASLEPVKTESLKTESNAESHLKMLVKLKPRSQSHTDDKPNEKPWHHGKRWKALRWRKWTIQIAAPKAGLQEPEEVRTDLRQELRSSLRPCSSSRDRRRCCFCQQEGDGLTDGAARLLNLDLDTWVHLNCALWSSEVYETQAGALINVEVARQRGQTISCAFCQRLGATSGCHRLRCLNVYHFTCALQAGCTFFKDKTMLCHQHRPRGGSSTSAAGLHLDQQVLRCFSVFRRVYVQRDELRQLASAVQRPELGHTFRVGSLIFHAMGQLPRALLPHFHSATAIFPPGYEASRLYWSMRNGWRRCRYVCSVEERQGRPEFSIRMLERGYEDLVLTDTTAKGVWDKVLGSVAERRAETGMLRLFPLYLKGEDLFGLTVSVVARIAESLPGVEACSRYRFRYGRNPLLELPLCINPSGSARSELKILSVWNRISCVMQNSAMAETGPSHSKHFVHSKSSQYRRLTSEWKSNVYLAHSRIQGLGLFAARDIEKQTMVIEYLGEILRTEVAMRKELHYKAKNRKAFMFHIDGEYVIDATCSGSPARYINHSCSPNCVAEVVTFERGYKIIISSSRRIEKGEELCYDYKLGLVRTQNLKMPCLCGAVNCRKWMN